MAELAVATLGTGTGAEGLVGLELAIRTAMVKLGASLLEQLLGADTGYAGPVTDCGAGHRATFVSNRPKTYQTVLGPITLARAYYHCGDCHRGVVPKDIGLGAAGGSLTPGLRAMVDRVGETVPFAKASELLEELAGISLPAKRIERCSEADGAALAEAADLEAAAFVDGGLAVLPSGETAAEKLYVAMDGTGVPMVPAELAGRKGKAEDGKARTREVKLAICFTQTDIDDEGHPVRDPGSSSYVATFELGTITIADRAGTSFTALAGSNGTFRARVPAGSYTVTGRSPLYQSGTSDCAIVPPATITVTAGGTTRITIDCQET